MVESELTDASVLSREKLASVTEHLSITVGALPRRTTTDITVSLRLQLLGTTLGSMDCNSKPTTFVPSCRSNAQDSWTAWALLVHLPQPEGPAVKLLEWARLTTEVEALQGDKHTEQDRSK
jgi:hypothetical protein